MMLTDPANAGKKKWFICWSILVVLMLLLMLSLGAQTRSTNLTVSEATGFDRGLIAYYPFNGNAKDESDHNRHGKVYGAKLTSDRFGNANSAYRFDGKDDYIQAPVNINPKQLPQCTIVAWARVDKRPRSVQVVSHDNGGYDRSLGIDTRGGGLGWSAFCGSGGVLGFQPVASNQWTFIAVVYDQAKGIVRLYVNGKKFEKKGILKVGKNIIRIGSNPSYGQYFDGDIDDVRIYNRTLSVSELEALFHKKDETQPVSTSTDTGITTGVASPAPEKGLIAYYPFNGNAADESDHNRHGKVYGAKLTNDRFGNANSAYRFDGKDDYIQAPVNINPKQLPQCTIVAWARVDKRPNRIQVVSHDNGGFDRSLGIDNRGGGLGWSAFCGSGGVLGFQPVASNQWTFIAVVYDQAKGIVRLYVNGKKFEKKGILKAGKNAIRIGSNPFYGQYFAGDIDDVRIYNRTLSVSELKALFHKKDETQPVSTSTDTSITTGVASPVSEKGLIAYYPFNGNTADESGHNRHAKVYGAKLALDRFGNANSAYHFDGKDDYIQAPVNINPAKLPRCTIVAWARVDKRPQRVQVVSHDNAGYDRSLGIDNRGGGLGWSAFCGSGGVLGFKPVALNQWTFVAVSYDQAKGIVKLYVNGKKFQKKGILKSGKNAIRIGSNPSYGQYFAGDIDDVRIYDRVLSATELNALYQKNDEFQTESISADTASTATGGNDEWIHDWMIMANMEKFGGGGKSGFYLEAVRSGHANPNPGRSGILYLHPVAQNKPAKLTRRVTLTGPRPVLNIGVSGNRKVDGDWVLVVKVNHRPLDRQKIIYGKNGWQDLSFDLSPYAGHTVDIDIEIHANNWWHEYAFIDYIEIK